MGIVVHPKGQRRDSQTVTSSGSLWCVKCSETLRRCLTPRLDVVPVNPETADQWSYPAFSGHFDGERIWGRGSSDDKSGLIGILSAAELMLENDFKPTRTLIFAFGEVNSKLIILY